MKFDLSTSDAAELTNVKGAIVALVPADQGPRGALGALDEIMDGAIARALKAGRFTAKHGETLAFPSPHGLAADEVILVGLGADALKVASARAAGGKAAGALGRLGSDGAHILLEEINSIEIASAFALGMLLRRYAFQSYKSSVEPKAELGNGSLTLVHPDQNALSESLSDAKAIVEGVFFTRDLVSEPANVLYPESFAERLEGLAEIGVEVEVMDDAALEKLGMNAMLSVGKGSECGCRVVVMKWMGGNAGDAPFCAVGKGVTFDTGGISLKPSSGMEEMTMDMGGAGVVSGLMKTIALRKAKANVIGIVGLVENMPDGKASRPGDIVTAMSGTTVEIINTDAEGRLVLADILHYAIKEFKPAATVNLATLTGAMIVALGHSKAGLFSNDDGLAANLLEAADHEGEGLWRLPLGKDYDELIKSKLADIKNTGGRAAGGITAAQFLQRFVTDAPWAHLDIAGVALSKETKPTCPKGASGWGVATLNHYISEQFEK